MLAFGSLALLLGCVFGSYVVSGGSFEVLVEALPFELWTIGGAAIASFVMANSTHELKHSLGGFKKIFVGATFNKSDYVDLLSLLYFLARLATDLSGWEALLAPHRGAKLISYHNTWPYFARRFRLDVVDVIESKEGIAPSPARLAMLASVIRKQHVRVILHEPFAPDDASQLLSRRTGAIVTKLAPSVGSVAEAADYLALFEHDVAILARALSAAPN